MEILNVNGVLTMSSLEIVKYVNSTRKTGDAEVTHADFLKKVPKVLNGVEGKFSSYYIASNGKQNPCYNFPKRESMLMAMSYSYELQAQLFDAWQELEQSSDLPNVQQKTFLHPLEITSAISLAVLPVLKSYGIDHNSAVISANRTAKEATGYDILALGNVQLEAPNQKYLPLTATELGNIKGITANKMNKLLAENAFQFKVGKDWTPTEKAKGFFKLLDIGKKHSNGTPVTHLKWYESVLAELKS